MTPTAALTSRQEIERLQATRLQAVLDAAGQTNLFWRAKYAAAGVDLTKFSGLGDLSRLPFCTKAEILADQLAHPPYGTNLTWPIERYSRLHQTSGTTGTPVRWLATPESWPALLKSWSELYALMGVTRQDRFFFPFSFGPFLGFWAAFEGANRLGHLCIPGGGLSSTARLTLMLENQATIVCCTPTYALRLIEVAAEQQIDLSGSAVRAVLVAGEPGGNIPAVRQRIETGWGASVFDHWGMTELGPLAIEAAGDPGSLYLLESACIAEIIDPQTDSAARPGDEGELVITNLCRSGSPLIRYRTGDRVRATPPGERPEAKAPYLRLDGGIIGRVDDMLTIRGNNVYPSALEAVIRQFDAVAEFRIVVCHVRSMQHLRIEVEPASAAVAAGQTADLARQIAEAIKDRWNFNADVVLVEVGGLPRFELKARRLVTENVSGT